MRLLLPLLLLLFSLIASGQKVSILKIELAGEKVLVFYDLEDNNPNNEYLLNLYSSKDNFANPLAKVKGDVGPEVKPGQNKKIEWNLREEYGGFKGKISLEIRGKVYVPFVKLNFDTKRAYKRGGNYNLAWKPGNTNPIHIELLKGSQRISGDLNHPNSGTYLLTFPAKITPGKDYRLRVTDSKNTDDIIYTDFFRITPKIPTALKVGAVLVLIGGVAVVAGGGGKKDNRISDIALPPFPGN